MCDGFFLGYGGDRQRIKINRVHRQIDDADDEHAHHHGTGQHALRILDFARDPRDVHPAIERPEDADQRDAESRDHGAQRHRLTGWNTDSIVRPMTVANRQSEHDEQPDGRELRPGRHVDQRRAALQPEHVDRGQQNDGTDGDKVPPRQRPSKNRRNGNMSRRHGQHRAEVFGEADGERGNGATLADGEDHPSVEKCGELAVGLAQKDILAARLGEHRSHLGEGEARQQRDKPAREPHPEEEPRRAHGRGNRSGGEKDAGADDAAGQQHHGIGERKAAHQRGFPMGRDCGLRYGGLRHESADAEVLGHFERRAAHPADYRRAVAASERIVHLARAVGTVQFRRMRRAVGGCFGSLSHMFRRL